MKKRNLKMGPTVLEASCLELEPRNGGPSRKAVLHQLTLALAERLRPFLIVRSKHYRARMGRLYSASLIVYRSRNS